MLLILQTKFHVDTYSGLSMRQLSGLRLCLTWLRLRRGCDEIMRDPVSNSLDAQGEGDQIIVYTMYLPSIATM